MSPAAGEVPYSGAEIEAAVKILREDAILTHSKKLEQRLQGIEERLGRMPVSELTAEEKAAEYDRLMAEKNKPPAPPAGGPPAPPGDPNAPPGPPPAPPKGETKPSTTERQVNRDWWSIYDKGQAS